MTTEPTTPHPETIAAHLATLDDEARLTPGDVLAMTGAVVTFRDVGVSEMTQGDEYDATVTVGSKSETFTYHGSKADALAGKAPDPADVLGCLFADYSCSDDAGGLAADELWRNNGDGCDDHPPSYWVDMAEALADNARKLRRLIGRNVDTFAERIEA